MPIDELILNRLKNNDRNVTDLDLTGQCTSDNDVKTLVDSLQVNTHLKKLTIKGNWDGSYPIRSGNFFTSQGAILLASLNSITELCIDNNPIGDEGVIALARNYSLRKLFANMCDIGVRGMYSFTQSKSLVDIKLHFNRKIRNEKNIAIADIEKLYNIIDSSYDRKMLADAFAGNYEAMISFIKYINIKHKQGMFLETYEDNCKQKDGALFFKSVMLELLDDRYDFIMKKVLVNNLKDYDPQAYRKKHIEILIEELEENILAAIDMDDIETLSRLIPFLRQGVNTYLEYGGTMLMYAVDKNKPNAAEYLIKIGARIEDHEREYTPLFTAAEAGHVETVYLLLKYGANITGEHYFNSETAFSIAAFKLCCNIYSLISNETLDGFERYFSYEMVELKDKIIRVWEKTHSTSIPWQIFGSDSNLRLQYTHDCIKLFEYFISNYPDDVLKNKEIVDEIHKYKKIYFMLFNKCKTLEEKAPIEKNDEDPTDYEENIELTYKVEPLARKSTSQSNLTNADLYNYINQLNIELQEKSEDNIDWSKYPKFFIAQFRGIHYYRKHFTKSQRRDHRETAHLNRIGAAPAAYHMSSLTPLQHQLSRESELKSNREKILKTFEDFKDTGKVEQYWHGKSKEFNNANEMLQQRMSNSYAGYKEDTQQPQHPSTKILFERKIIGYPHYATSDLPYHALKYAYGQKKVDGLTEWRLRPRFQMNGKPQHPYPGKIFISIFTPLQMYHHRMRHVAGMHNRELIALKGTVAPERETSAPGGVEADVPFYEELLVIPSFEHYSEDYAHKYGIGLNAYNKFKEEIALSFLHANLMTRDAIRKSVKNKIIEKTLMPYKEKQLLALAEAEAKRRGGYLIYRYYDGTYGLNPEPMRIPSRGNSFYPKRELDLLKDTTSKRQQPTKDESKSATGDVKFPNRALQPAPKRHRVENYPFGGPQRPGRQFNIQYNNYNLIFKEITIPGDGWCLLTAIGIANPQLALQHLKLCVSDPIISRYLSEGLYNDLLSGELKPPFADGEKDSDGGLIHNRIRYLYEACQASDNKVLETDTLESRNLWTYLKRPEVLTTYLLYIERDKYVNQQIASAYLILQNKHLCVIQEQPNSPQGYTIFSKDGINLLTNDNIVYVIYKPNEESTRLSHYDSLELLDRRPLEQAQSHIAAKTNLSLSPVTETAPGRFNTVPTLSSPAILLCQSSPLIAGPKKSDPNELEGDLVVIEEQMVEHVKEISRPK